MRRYNHIDIEYYAPWEWRPISHMPDGCNEIIIRDTKGNIREICSCDFWWMTKSDKELYDSFRFE